MNQISFPLDTAEKQYIFIDGEPLWGSRTISWPHLLSSLEQSGYWDILTCSCGQRECGGLLAVNVFSVDGVVAWRTYQPLPGNNFCFDKQQMIEAILSSLEYLEWWHFFNCDVGCCHCPSVTEGRDVPLLIREAKERLGGGNSAGNSLVLFDPTAKLLGAICRGDTEAVDYWAGAGADVNHLSDLEEYGPKKKLSVLHTALMFAPKAEKLPIVKLLVEHGADIGTAVVAYPEMMMADIVTAGDSAVGMYLAGKILGLSDKTWA